MLFSIMFMNTDSNCEAAWLRACAGAVLDLALSVASACGSSAKVELTEGAALEVIR